MLENWCWKYETLASLSKYYSSLSPEYLQIWLAGQKDENGDGVVEEKIPPEIFDGLVKEKNNSAAWFLLRQLHMSMFDMTIYSPSTHQKIREMDFPAIWNRSRLEIEGIEGPEAEGLGYEWRWAYAGVPHYISGYDAGLYGYI